MRNNDCPAALYYASPADICYSIRHLEGLKNISPGRNLQLIPYGMFSAARFLDNPATGSLPFRTENDAP